MKGFVKGVAIVAGSALALAVAYFVLRVADTWEKRNTDSLVDGLGTGLMFLFMMIIVILAVVLTLKMALRNKEAREAGYQDEYYAPARQGRGQQPAYQYDYNVPVGQPQAGRQLPGPVAGTPIPWGQQGYQQGFAPNYAMPGQMPQGQQQGGYGFPLPPPEGQLSAQGAQYDLSSNLGW